jgi:hypothetical protein
MLSLRFVHQRARNSLTGKACSCSRAAARPWIDGKGRTYITYKECVLLEEKRLEGA